MVTLLFESKVEKHFISTRVDKMKTYEKGIEIAKDLQNIT